MSSNCFGEAGDGRGGVTGEKEEEETERTVAFGWQQYEDWQRDGMQDQAEQECGHWWTEQAECVPICEEEWNVREGKAQCFTIHQRPDPIDVPKNTTQAHAESNRCSKAQFQVGICRKN